MFVDWKTQYQCQFSKRRSINQCDFSQMSDICVCMKLDRLIKIHANGKAVTLWSVLEDTKIDDEVSEMSPMWKHKERGKSISRTDQEAQMSSHKHDISGLLTLGFRGRQSSFQRVLWGPGNQTSWPWPRTIPGIRRTYWLKGKARGILEGNTGYLQDLGVGKHWTWKILAVKENIWDIFTTLREPGERGWQGAPERAPRLAPGHFLKGGGVFTCRFDL